MLITFLERQPVRPRMALTRGATTMPVYVKCHPNEVPQGAVVVNVWKAMGRTVADVASSTCPNADEYVAADFPRPVPLALERAAEVCKACGLDTVAVVADDAIWREDWLKGRTAR
jgi:hypothetical protein